MKNSRIQIRIRDGQTGPEDGPDKDIWLWWTSLPGYAGSEHIRKAIREYIDRYFVFEDGKYIEKRIIEPIDNGVQIGQKQFTNQPVISAEQIQTLMKLLQDNQIDKIIGRQAEKLKYIVQEESPVTPVIENTKLKNLKTLK